MANVVEPGVCEACGRQLPTQAGKGRIRRYCDARCRDAARRRRERASRRGTHQVKYGLTGADRDAKLDSDDAVPGTDNPLALAVVDAARRLVGELVWSSSPDAAVVAARDLLTTAEAALQAAVDRARTGGQSWREIGNALGTSRQAAFQRFGRPVDPRTGIAMARIVTAEAVRRATEFVALFTAGRWEEVLGHFDDRMREAHDAARLANGWAQLAGMFGRYERMGELHPVAAADSSVVDVVLHFEAGEAMLWVRFDPDGRVSALRLHRAYL